MRSGHHGPALLLAAALALACDEARPPPPIPIAPPPLPSLPIAADLPEPEPAATTARARSPRAQDRRVRTDPTTSKARPSAGAASVKAREGATPSSAAPVATRTTAPVSGPTPTPPTPASKPAAKRVVVPSTAHVRAEIPSGLQSDLDADPRMQPWLERVIAIIDGCHARDRAARGTLEAAITMHESARPDADIRSLPPQLSSLVACATGSLLRTKMPLFTGREGARYVVRIHVQ